MQVIAASLDVSYFSNAHCAVFGAPFVAERLRSRSGGINEFASVHGRTRGPNGPSECGAWWYRFFERNKTVLAAADVTPDAQAALRRSLALMERAAGRPLVLKNLLAALRLAPISTALPGALYIHLSRNRADNARSILHARRDITGAFGAPWSVPLGQREHLSPAASALSQIAAIDTRIKADADALGLTMLHIDYDSFCADPEATMTLITKFAGAQGLSIARQAPAPSRFPRRPAKALPEPIEADLKALIQ